MLSYHKIHETGWDGDFRTTTLTTNPNWTEISGDPLMTITNKVNSMILILDGNSLHVVHA